MEAHKRNDDQASYDQVADKSFGIHLCKYLKQFCNIRFNDFPNEFWPSVLLSSAVPLWQQTLSSPTSTRPILQRTYGRTVVSTSMPRMTLIPRVDAI